MSHSHRSIAIGEAHVFKTNRCTAKSKLLPSSRQIRCQQIDHYDFNPDNIGRPSK